MGIFMNRIRLLIGLAAAIALAGCVTIVSGGVASPSSNGVRYHLPQPVLVVTPQPDGTLTVKSELIPDESKAYYLRAASFLSSYTFGVEVANGLLSSVNMKSDSTQVATGGIAAAQAVREARNTAKLAAQAEADKQTAATASAVASAEAAVRTAHNALDVALAVRDRTAASGDAEALEAAELAVIRARFALDDAHEELARLRQGAGAPPAPSPAADGMATADGVAPTADAPSDGQKTRQPADITLAWGPVIYSIQQTMVDGLPTVRLVEAQWHEQTMPSQVAGQVEFRSATTAMPTSAHPTEVRFDYVDSSVIRPDTTGALRFTLKASRKIGGFAGPYPHGTLRALDTGAPTATQAATTTLLSDRVTVVVDLPASLAAGRYEVEFRYHVDHDPVPHLTRGLVTVER